MGLEHIAHPGFHLPALVWELALSALPSLPDRSRTVMLLKLVASFVSSMGKLQAAVWGVDVGVVVDGVVGGGVHAVPLLRRSDGSISGSAHIQYVMSHSSQTSTVAGRAILGVVVGLSVEVVVRGGIGTVVGGVVGVGVGAMVGAEVVDVVVVVAVVVGAAVGLVVVVGGVVVVVGEGVGGGAIRWGVVHRVMRWSDRQVGQRMGHVLLVAGLLVAGLVADLEAEWMAHSSQIWCPHSRERRAVVGSAHAAAHGFWGSSWKGEGRWGVPSCCACSSRRSRMASRSISLMALPRSLWISARGRGGGGGVAGEVGGRWRVLCSVVSVSGSEAGLILSVSLLLPPVVRVIVSSGASVICIGVGGISSRPVGGGAVLYVIKWYWKWR
jgi:hypothetical protein